MPLGRRLCSTCLILFARSRVSAAGEIPRGKFRECSADLAFLPNPGLWTSCLRFFAIVAIVESFLYKPGVLSVLCL